VPKTETVNVTVYKNVPKTETVNVTVYKNVPKTETVNVTVNKTVTETIEVPCTTYTTRQVPHEATRRVPLCVPVQEKVVCTRMVPVTVEKEVIVCVDGGDECGRRHRLFGWLLGCW
jgi:hypothetical protein